MTNTRQCVNKVSRCFVMLSNFTCQNFCDCLFVSIDIIVVECLIIGVYSLRLFYSLETLLVIRPQLAKTQSQEFECFEDNYSTTISAQGCRINTSLTPKEHSLYRALKHSIHQHKLDLNFE